MLILGFPTLKDRFYGFTDWDLGVYIQAVIDAQKLGLIGNDGAWDFSARIDKVLTFLENRPLNTTRLSVPVLRCYNWKRPFFISV